MKDSGKADWSSRLSLLLVPVLAIFVYLNALDGEFVWDDRKLIVSDYTIKSFDNITELFVNDFFYRNENDLAYGYYRPIISVTYLMDFTSPPQPDAEITAGSTWFFQFWFRDPAAGGAFFNLSNGLRAKFCP